MEVLHGALREVLALWNWLRLFMRLDKHAGDAALSELDSQAQANRPSTHDDDSAWLRRGGCIGFRVFHSFLSIYIAPAKR
jgi:hypothetical protein